MEESNSGGIIDSRQPKRQPPRDLFAEVYSFTALNSALDRALRGKRRRVAPAKFAIDRERHLLDLAETLRTRTWKPGRSETFRLWDRKERIIVVPPFADRVVHHALCAVLEPRLERRMIHHTYACRNGKGTTAAVAAVHLYVRKYRYVLCLDVDKHFASVLHEPLLNSVRKAVKDPGVLWLVETILKAPLGQYDVARGLPIGQLTSQLFGNVILDPLDHHLTDDLATPGYVRYMDDMRIFANDKDHLWFLATEVTQTIAPFGLKLSSKVTRVLPVAEGVPFLGFRIFPNTIRLERGTAVRAARLLRAALKQMGTNPDDALQSLQGVIAHLRGANTLRFRQSVIGSVLK